jgi:hypothetical protein
MEECARSGAGSKRYLGAIVSVRFLMYYNRGNRAPDFVTCRPVVCSVRTAGERQCRLTAAAWGN